jgi:hypothetical protein
MSKLSISEAAKIKGDSKKGLKRPKYRTKNEEKGCKG